MVFFSTGRLVGVKPSSELVRTRLDEYDSSSPSVSSVLPSFCGIFNSFCSDIVRGIELRERYAIRTIRETTHGERGDIMPDVSIRKQPRENINRIEVGPRTVITDKENKYLLSELSRMRKVPGELFRKTSLARSPEIFPQYQQDSRRTLSAPKIKKIKIF